MSIRMRPQSYFRLHSISAKIRELVLHDLSPGDRLPSEREIADLLGESHNRVHRALRILIEDGVVYSSGCRRGLFLLSKQRVRNKFPATPKKIPLTFLLPLDAKSRQAQIWQRICENFRLLFPQVEFNYLFDQENISQEADLYLTWPPLLDCSLYRPLDTEDILSEELKPEDLLPRVLETGFQYGRQYAVPVLHSPAAFWGHRNLLARNGLKIADFKVPVDFFRWGKQLDNINQCAMGFAFYGFIYHASHWGVEIEKKSHCFLMCEERLSMFLTAIEPYVKSPQLPFAPFNFSKYFCRGQLALLAGYLHTLPINEQRFQLLGQPLLEGGFACQTALMLSVGKATRQMELITELIRFILSRGSQNILFYPETLFSVRKDMYFQQLEKVRKKEGVSIPSYDFRGFLPQLDLDFYCLCGPWLYSECANYLCGFSNLELALERISLIDIPKMRKKWLDSISPHLIQKYAAYVKASARKAYS